MRTPKEYTQNLKNRVITQDMLAASLFSVNKRAKNCRDQEREYRYDRYDTKEKYREKKEHYYEQKEKMLALLTPTCIHSEPCKRRVRYYDEEFTCIDPTHEVVKSGRYYDRDEQRYVEFMDVLENDRRFYLYYELGDYSFHKPIYNTDLKKLGLEIKQIDELETTGEDISDLISTQFVNKLLELIEEGDYQLCV